MCAVITNFVPHVRKKFGQKEVYWLRENYLMHMSQFMAWIVNFHLIRSW